MGFNQVKDNSNDESTLCKYSLKWKLQFGLKLMHKKYLMLKNPYLFFTTLIKEPLNPVMVHTVIFKKVIKLILVSFYQQLIFVFDDTFLLVSVSYSQSGILNRDIV